MTRWVLRRISCLEVPHLLHHPRPWHNVFVLHPPTLSEKKFWMMYTPAFEEGPCPFMKIYRISEGFCFADLKLKALSREGVKVRQTKWEHCGLIWNWLTLNSLFELCYLLCWVERLLLEMFNKDFWNDDLTKQIWVLPLYSYIEFEMILTETWFIHFQSTLLMSLFQVFSHNQELRGSLLLVSNVLHQNLILKIKRKGNVLKYKSLSLMLILSFKHME